MSSLIFRGVQLRYFDGRYKDDAGYFTRLHLQADLSDPIREHFGWGQIPEGLTTAKFVGALTSRNLVLTPNDKALRQHEVQMECSEVGDFAATSETNDEGEVTGHRLNFIARSVESGAATRLEQYLRTVGRGDAALKVSYEKQEKLDLGESGEGGKESAQHASQPMQSLGDVMDETEDNETEVVQEAPLATAREAAGGTHAKGRRARKAADLPSAPGDGEGGGDGILKAIHGGGKDEAWDGTITVLDRDGVLSWAVAVKVKGGPMAEADCKGEPPLSIPAAASEAAEYVAEWADSQLSTGERDIKLAAAQIRSWALNVKADNRVSAPTESSIRVARGGRIQ